MSYGPLCAQVYQRRGLRACGGCSPLGLREALMRSLTGRLEGLRRIGVDEFSYRKRHRYLTTVVDHDRSNGIAERCRHWP